MLSEVKNIHLVGIGGIGMSGLAFLLKEKGFNVKGSDLEANSNVKRLEEEGIKVFIGHRREQIAPDTQLLVYSSAVKEDNPEVLEAQARGVTVLKRGKLLGYICQDKKTVAVGGSHGKTTVTSLLSYILTSLGWRPTVFVGGLPLNYNCWAWWGDDYFVVETDESDGSFLELSPWVSIITNIDYEHLNYYQSIENLKGAFLKFARQSKEKVFGLGDDPRVRDILYEVEGLSFGWGEKNKLRGTDFRCDGEFSYFNLLVEGRLAVSLKVPLLGEYNCLNVLAVLCFFHYLGEDLEKIAKLVEDFRGTKRRFQIKKRIRGVTFVDDYAHHPTQIRAVLGAARRLNFKRIFVIFQPHRLSRVKLLYKEFSRSFHLADEVVITDIYSAHEAEIRGVSAEELCEKIKKVHPGRTRYIPQERLVKEIPLSLEEGDLVLGLGAGDINILMEAISHEFEKHRVEVQC